MTSAIGSVPPTTDLAARLYRSLEALVIKSELTLAEQDEMRRRSNLPARRCACDSLRAGPGCLPCLVKRGRAAMAEYEASIEAALPDCSTCGKPDPENITVQYGIEGTWTAQCRACYVAMREREMAAINA